MKKRRALPPLQIFRTQEWKESLLCVNEDIGKEQSPARAKAPAQKRRAVIRVESAETQDYVSESKGPEGSDDEEMEELSFIPSAVSESRWALRMCDNRCGHCVRRRMSSAQDQLVQVMLQ